MTRSAATALAAALASTIAACAPGAEPVAMRVAVVGDDPFLGADAVFVRLERADGTTVSDSLLPGSARDFVVGPLPYDTTLRAVVETRLGDLPLARGRSFPFSVAMGGGRTGSPDLTLGVLGRHAELAVAAPAAIVAVAPTSTGALLATADTIVPFVAHGADGRPALGAPIALPAARVGATFAPLGGGLVAIGGAAAGATLFDEAGTVALEIEGGTPAVRDVTVVAVSASVALAIGGSDVGGAFVGDVVRFELGATLATRALEPIEPRAGARAVALEAMSPEGGAARVLLHDGRDAAGPREDVLVIDPSGVSPTEVRALPLLHGAASVAIETGQVAFLGGRRSDGTVADEVALRFVDVAGRLELLSPAPPLLFRARTDAAALALDRGVALVLGGRDDAGPLDSAELVDLRVLPGRLSFTGSMPRPGADVVAALLGDGTVLVAGGGALSLYFPPLS